MTTRNGIIDAVPASKVPRFAGKAPSPGSPTSLARIYDTLRRTTAGDVARSRIADARILTPSGVEVRLGELWRRTATAGSACRLEAPEDSARDSVPSGVTQSVVPDSDAADIAQL